MKVTFQNPTVTGCIDVSDELAPFFLWLSQGRDNERVKALIILLAEHDREPDAEEKQNIRRTLDEILENTRNVPTGTQENENSK
jgi:hypothetical protein